jgi:hypothetical protein
VFHRPIDIATNIAAINQRYKCFMLCMKSLVNCVVSTVSKVDGRSPCPTLASWDSIWCNWNRDAVVKFTKKKLVRFCFTQLTKFGLRHQLWMQYAILHFLKTNTKSVKLHLFDRLITSNDYWMNECFRTPMANDFVVRFALSVSVKLYFLCFVQIMQLL